jgi:hypothetical protein
MTARQLTRCALLLLVLGALGVQQWAAQAHWLEHLPGAQVAADSGGGSGEGSRTHDCRWCQIAAHAVGAAPPSQALRLPARACLGIALPAADAAAQFSSSPAWAWQSRGPPTA